MIKLFFIFVLFYLVFLTWNLKTSFKFAWFIVSKYSEIFFILRNFSKSLGFRFLIFCPLRKSIICSRFWRKKLRSPSAAVDLEIKPTLKKSFRDEFKDSDGLFVNCGVRSFKIYLWKFESFPTKFAESGRNQVCSTWSK